MSCAACDGHGKLSYQGDSGITESPCIFCHGYGYFLWNEFNASHEIKPTPIYYGEQAK